MSIQGPGDRSNLNRLQRTAGATPTNPSTPTSKASGQFSVRPPAETPGVGAGGPMQAASHGALVQRIRERLASGQSADAVLKEEVNREVTACIGRADPRIVEKVAEDVRRDPSLSEIFAQLLRRAADPQRGSAPAR